jgi:hypothetical protein
MEITLQGVSTFSRLRAKFALAYQLVGRKLINGENVLKLYESLLKLY